MISSKRAVSCAAFLVSIALACSGPQRPEPPSTQESSSLPEVSLVAPERRPVSRDLSLTATVESYEQALLYAKVSGYLKSIAVDIGDHVVKGQVLATLEAPEVRQQQLQAAGERDESRAQRRKAEAEQNLARTEFIRSRDLRAKEAITQEEMEEAEARYETAKAGVEVARSRERSAEARLTELRVLMGYAQIVAPFDGLVTRRFVDPGALIQSATSSNNVTPVVTVARIDPVRVSVDVPEPFAPYARTGAPATLKVAAVPGRTFRGSITRSAEALDSATRTMRTEVDLQNADASLRPGMYGKLTIALQGRTDTLSLPPSVVHQDDRGTFVYLLQDRKAVQHRVQLGLTSDQRDEIFGGLGEDDRVLSSGDQLRDGTPVRVATRAGAGRVAGER